MIPCRVKNFHWGKSINWIVYKSRYFKSPTHVPFAISSLFLPKYWGILLVLTAWRREMLIINVIWFHVRQNCQKLLNNFTIFSFICWKSSCDKIEENVLHLYLKNSLSAPVDRQSCVFDDKFHPFKVNISSHVWNLFTFGTDGRHSFSSRTE